ncbi:MAG: SH3 domain-containing protein [Sphingomonas sp.]
MKSSGISSSKAGRKAHPANRPSNFALKGHSVALDPRHNAVRPDLADIRLAEFVFAPHYAAPIALSVIGPVALRAGPDAGAEILCMLNSGDVFEALDFTGSNAWGKAAVLDLVGYVDSTALGYIDKQAAE